MVQLTTIRRSLHDNIVEKLMAQDPDRQNYTKTPQQDFNFLTSIIITVFSMETCHISSNNFTVHTEEVHQYQLRV